MAPPTPLLVLETKVELTIVVLDAPSLKMAPPVLPTLPENVVPVIVKVWPDAL